MPESGGLRPQAQNAASGTLQAQLKQGVALHQQGQLAEAECIYGEVLRQQPNHFDALHSLGVIALQTGRTERGIELIRRAIKLNAKIAAAHNNLGTALRSLKRPAEALASYDKAIALKPDFAEAHNNRGNVLRDLRRPAEALASYDRAIALKPDYAEAHSNRGNALLDVKRPADALASYDKAIALKPDYAEVYSNRGIALTDKGDFTAAIESYNRALQIKPDYAECYRHYSMVTKFKQDNSIIPKMKKLICAENLSENDLVQLSFALAKSEDDLGNKEFFIDHLIRGNAIRKKILAYDIAQDNQLFASIKRFFGSDAANKQADFVPNCSTTPIFILGMPRSGTTLVEQIVSSHSNVFGAGELDFLNQAIINSRWQVDKDRKQVFSSGRTFYNLKISEVSAASIITDKMPLNFRWIGFILNALPDAKIVHVKRNPAAVCWSNLKTYFPSEEIGFTFDRQDIAKYYRLYKDLMDFWQRKYPDKIYNLNYERLTENQEEETRKLLDYLELEWEDNVLEFYKNTRSVSTASNLQVRQKMYKGSSLEWKKYEQWLQPMLDILNA
jgi:tetratricopeptide (TPR) repeat protein